MKKIFVASIVILGVFHVSSSPEIWASRSPGLSFFSNTVLSIGFRSTPLPPATSQTTKGQPLLAMRNMEIKKPMNNVADSETNLLIQTSEASAAVYRFFTE